MLSKRILKPTGKITFLTQLTNPTGLPLLSLSIASARAFRSSVRRFETQTIPLPAGKPVGAFRGGFIGFLLGTSIGAYGSYYYLFEDYRRSNDILNEDMYALQVAVTRLTNYVTSLEAKVDQVRQK